MLPSVSRNVDVGITSRALNTGRASNTGRGSDVIVLPGNRGLGLLFEEITVNSLLAEGIHSRLQI